MGLRVWKRASESKAAPGSLLTHWINTDSAYKILFTLDLCSTVYIYNSNVCVCVCMCSHMFSMLWKV